MSHVLSAVGPQARLALPLCIQSRGHGGAAALLALEGIAARRSCPRAASALLPRSEPGTLVGRHVPAYCTGKPSRSPCGSETLRGPSLGYAHSSASARQPRYASRLASRGPHERAAGELLCRTGARPWPLLHSRTPARR